MCFWYADSTFEVLVDICKAEVCTTGKHALKKGSFSWGKIDYIAYSGVARKPRMETNNANPESPNSSENESYEQRLVDMQSRLIADYGRGKKDWSEEDLRQLPSVERQSIEQNGWNIAQFLNMIQNMPSYQKLLDDSISRDKEVWEILQKVCCTQKKKVFINGLT